MKDLFVIMPVYPAHRLLARGLKQERNSQFDCILSQRCIKDGQFYSFCNKIKYTIYNICLMVIILPWSRNIFSCQVLNSFKLAKSFYPPERSKKKKKNLKTSIQVAPSFIFFQDNTLKNNKKEKLLSFVAL